MIVELYDISLLTIADGKTIIQNIIITGNHCSWFQGYIMIVPSRYPAVVPPFSIVEKELHL